jgi:hypothetical protein
MTAITFTDSEKVMMIKLYESKLVELDKEKKEIHNLLSKLRSDSDGIPTTRRQTLTRDKKYTWKGLLPELLKEANDFLMTDEVYSLVLKRDPELQTQSRKKIISTLSGTLSILASEGKLLKMHNPFVPGKYYGLKEWFDEFGRPLEEYTLKFQERNLSIENLNQQS